MKNGQLNSKSYSQNIKTANTKESINTLIVKIIIDLTENLQIILKQVQIITKSIKKITSQNKKDSPTEDKSRHN